MIDRDKVKSWICEASHNYKNAAGGIKTNGSYTEESLSQWAKEAGYTIIGNIEEREVEI